MSIKLDVKLLFDLSGYAPRKSMPFCMCMHEGATVKSLLQKLKIPLSADLVALVDGVPKGLADALPSNGRGDHLPHGHGRIEPRPPGGMIYGPQNLNREIWLP